MKHVFENFLEPLVIVFGEPKTNDVTKFLNEYAAVLEHFDEDELVEAKKHLMRTHKIKSFPVPAECLAACDAAQKDQGPDWPKRALERIEAATEAADLTRIERVIKQRKSRYFAETTRNLLEAVNAKRSDLGVEVVDLSKRLIGEG